MPKAMLYKDFIVVLFDCICLVVAQQQELPPTSLQGDGTDDCPPLATALNTVNDQVFTLLRDSVVPSLIGTLPEFAVSSCSSLPQGVPSGNYYITTTNTSTSGSVLKYCDMTRTSCCSTTGGWMRVANIDMSDPNQQCPSPLQLWINQYDTSVPGSLRICGRDPETVHLCVSIFFPVNGIQYSKVCGRIHAYQYSNTNGFARYNQHRVGIDDPLGYMDGISITHGSPRQHIWTFTAGIHDPPSYADSKCPCTNSAASVPPYVGNDYFCETGSHDQVQWPVLYRDDPLWDGQGCISGTSACQCMLNNPPYFCKQLSQPTRDDIEVRICCDNDPRAEGTPFDIMEIYVQ